MIRLPDFPWDQLAPLGDKARTHSDGIVDLSIGTPVDPVPEVIQAALKLHANSPGYPPTVGISQLQDSLRTWSMKHLSGGRPVSVIPSIGSKEMVTLLPMLLGAKRVLYPEIAYPSYAVGALIAGATAIPVSADPATWPEADLVWLNTPSNPTGEVLSPEQLAASVRWAKANNAVLASDECYFELGWEVTPTSALSVPESESAKVITLYSLSKRSNLAGYRAGFVAGNNEVISELLEVRKHIGLMTPGPVQQAMIAALADEEHVQVQRERYRNRRVLLRQAFESAGFTVEHSQAGLYLWMTRNEDCWQSATWLSERGILVAPGSFYGEKCRQYIRAALTVTDERVAAAVKRLAS